MAARYDEAPIVELDQRGRIVRSPFIRQELVTDGRIGQAPRASPERALLSWWSSVQRGDSERVVALTSSRAIDVTGTATIRRAVSLVAPSFGHPDVVRIERRGRHAMVYLVVYSYRGGEPSPALAVPAKLAMFETSAGWRVNDVDLLVDSAAAIERKNPA